MLNSTLQNDIRKTCESYLNVFCDEKEKLVRYVDQLQDDVSLNDRKNMVGHVTASGLVISPNDEVLLIFHKAHKRYQQPGGHVDNEDNSLVEAAMREVSEETGLGDVTLHPWHTKNKCPINIDSHPIAERPEKNEGPHFHHDHMYVFTTGQSDISLQIEEVSDWQWVDYKNAPIENAHVALSILKAQKRGLV